MNEFDRLEQSFGHLETPGDIPFNPSFKRVPDEGMTPKFIEWLKSKPENLQANFLSFLVPYRSACVPRLLELAASRDEETSLIAYEALLKINKYYSSSKEKLHLAFLHEIHVHPRDQRVMILHCLREGFMYVADKEGVEILKYYRDYAAKNDALIIVKWLDVVLRAYK
ncbi:MAG: hypothetical protein EOP04_19360 [Proteobacteria bacterium]|nr:MAG: hypothetical protein EOP04_19360 [Pseudomonadota bacterium]